jgi:hypothetical protein
MEYAFEVLFTWTFFAIAFITCIGAVIGFAGLIMMSLVKGYHEMVGY